MNTATISTVTVRETIHAPLAKVWTLWTEPEHIKKWNQASGDWYTPHAENDLRPGGEFLSRMESGDGKTGFDFRGKYLYVGKEKEIRYQLEDGRKVTVHFEWNGQATVVTETFEIEKIHSPEMQKAGWQAILSNFKNYTETLNHSN